MVNLRIFVLTFLFFMGCFSTASASVSLRLEVYADSTLSGQDGFLVDFFEPGSEETTLFVFEEAGHVRFFAIRLDGDPTWQFYPPETYWTPAPGDGIGASWRFPDDEEGGVQTATLEAFESVNVPAGIFNTARCVIRRDTEPETIAEILSFADGIGHVLWHFVEDMPPSGEVLTSYFIVGGAGYMPLAVGNWWEYEPYVTAVGDLPVSPNLLYPAVPNPFNPNTDISFEMANAGHASLRVYNEAGHLIRTLVNGQYPTGRHTVTWNGCDSQGRAMPSGIYLVRLETESGIQSRKMTLVR